MLHDVADFLFKTDREKEIAKLVHEKIVAKLTFDRDLAIQNNAHSLAMLKITLATEIKVLQINGEAKVAAALNELLEAQLEEKFILYLHAIRMKALYNKG